MRWMLLLASHVIALGAGFGAGVYALPILVAPPAPDAAALSVMAERAIFSGAFRRDLEGSDALHWGEGTVSVGPDAVSLVGRLAPGPDYQLYLVPRLVETEGEFMAVKAESAHLGAVRSFDGFVVPIPASVDPGNYSAVLVWCESFGQFITAAAYR